MTESFKEHTKAQDALKFTYNKINTAMQSISDQKASGIFHAELHAAHLKTLLTALKSDVKSGGVKRIPQYIHVEEGDSDQDLYYLPYSNVVIRAESTDIDSEEHGFELVPNLTKAETVQDSVWSVDQPTVDSITKGLISLLPSNVSTLILPKAA